MKRLKGKAQSHPQPYLGLFPAALNLSGPLNGSNSRRPFLILMSHLQTRPRVRSHRAALYMTALKMTFCCFVCFSLSLSFLRIDFTGTACYVQEAK